MGHATTIRCASSGALHGRTTQTAAGCNADAAVGATGMSRHLRLRIRAARRLHRLAVRGTVGPWRTAHATARTRTGRAGCSPWRISRASAGRVPDTGLRPLERPYPRPFIPGFSVCRGAAPGPARTPRVYAPALNAALARRRATQAAIHAQVVRTATPPRRALTGSSARRTPACDSRNCTL